MTNAEFVELYKAKVKALANECEEQIKNGELTEEEASFRFYMVRDDILWSMDDPDDDL